MKSQTARFLASCCPDWSDRAELTLSPIRAGLESAVARARVNFSSHAQSALPRRFVVKELRGAQRREKAVYQELWREGARPPAARVLGSEAAGDADYLYLEEIRSATNWPWADGHSAAAVCRDLAKLHALPSPGAEVFSEWDYERELAASAQATLAFAVTARDRTGARIWRRPGDLQRVVAALPQMRAEVRAGGVTLIHGDVHPGNVLVRNRGRTRQIVFIDWARARIGSPLEDLASWLHSLGCWEPEAQRRHDTLLGIYLRARGTEARLDAGLRRRYWFACASNGLAGAIRYHLSVLADASASLHQRTHSQRALPAWERAIRRAAALLAPPGLVARAHGNADGGREAAALAAPSP